MDEERKYDEFTLNYQKTLSQICPGTSSQNGGIYLIEKVVEYVKPQLSSSNVLNYLFADHGWNHSLRLSSIVPRITSKIIETEYSFKSWEDTLVLLWTAIAFHDIGMVEFNDEEIKEHMIKQLGRVDHVNKSGDWIDKIIDVLNNKQKTVDSNTDNFCLHWSNYWDDQNKDIDEISAMRLVKDIVLMHGESQYWLVDNKIAALDRNIFNLDFDETTSKIYKPLISLAEAILCLSDLLDICPERMFIFENEGLNNFFYQMDPNSKKVTYEHWASHNLATVNYSEFFEKGVIFIDVLRNSQTKDLCLNTALYNRYCQLGAIKPCLEWGNKREIKKILSPFGYSGIQLRFAKQNLRKWKRIDEIASKFEFNPENIISKINKELITYNTFVEETLIKWIDKKFDIDKESLTYNEVKSTYNLFKKGACIHLLYDQPNSKTISQSFNYFYITLDNENYTYNKSDALLAAINLAFILSDRNEKIDTNIFISYKGSKSFSELLYGQNPRKLVTIFILIIDNVLEDDLSKIVKTLKRNDPKSYIIFANATNATKIEDDQIENIKYSLSSEKFNNIKSNLGNYASQHWGNNKSLNETDRSQIDQIKENEKVGLGEYLKELKCVYNGIEVIKEEIYQNLSKNNFSHLLIIDLFEMLSGSERKVEKEKLCKLYEAFCQNYKLNSVYFQELTQVHAILEKLCIEDNGILLLKDDYKESFDKLIIDSSNKIKDDVNQHLIKKELFQRMIFFWLYNYHEVNFKSICYREYLTLLSAENLCDFILNNNIVIEERINVAFETVEIFVSQMKLKNETKSVLGFLKIYFPYLLRKSEILSTEVLSTNEDIIKFQSVYRLFRGILDPNLIVHVNDMYKLISSSDIGILGFLEGICSSNLSQSNAMECINLIKENLNYMFINSDDTIKYMLCDIIFYYEKSDLFPDINFSEWQNICFRLRNSNLEDMKNDPYLDKFYKVRRLFLNVLNMTSPLIRKRNQIVL